MSLFQNAFEEPVLHLTRCCIYCANSIWIGNEKSAINPFAALKGDPRYAIEILREESPDEAKIKARI